MKSLKEILSIKIFEENSYLDTRSKNNAQLDVIIALLPVAFYGCLLFGFRSALVILISTASSFISELIWNLVFKRKLVLGSLSPIITGLLLGVSFPHNIPLWIPAISGIISIILIKKTIGIFTKNPVNPALASWLLLFIVSHKQMTAFLDPFTDAVTMATPLVQKGDITFKSVFFGQHAGCIGEISALLLIVGGLYLILRRVISPIIPIFYIGTVCALSAIAKVDILAYTFGGSLLLGAFFMATDPETSPKKIIFQIPYAIGCGALTFLIRKFTPLPEGVAIAILALNLINSYIHLIPFKKIITSIFKISKADCK